MTLLLRPPGRGNWTPVRVTITGRHCAPLLDARPGMLLTLGRMTWRIVKVTP